MVHNSKKLGFWAVFALVTGSQIGSGIFMLPTTLAPYGLYAFAGWAISGIGAIALALVFAKLCQALPQTGGPHVYVQKAFGRTAAFFVGWTYWVISWVSTTAVITAVIGNLMPLCGQQSMEFFLVLQLAMLIGTTAINWYGVTTAGKAEFLLTILKVIPLIIIPVIALFYFDINNFVIDTAVMHLPSATMLSRVTLLTLWGFVGLECATAPAGAIENPGTTIPRAIVSGTAAVALLYVVNSLGIMGVFHGTNLMTSYSPYADVVTILFGGTWSFLISGIAAIICLGTLNAWMLTSGQIALGLAQDDLMPAWFGKKNKHDVPSVGLLASAVGIAFLLLCMANKSFEAQILGIIDVSVTAFLFVYLMCCAAFFKLFFFKKTFEINDHWALAYGLVAALFCAWVILQTSLSVLVAASLFVISGIPVYWYVRSENK